MVLRRTKMELRISNDKISPVIDDFEIAALGEVYLALKKNPNFAKTVITFERFVEKRMIIEAEKLQKILKSKNVASRN